MKKIIFISMLTILMLGITGCGCSHKQTLKCEAKFDDYNEISTIEATFKDGYLVKEKVSTKVLFNDNESAKVYYDMYADNDEYKVTMEDNNVILVKEFTNDSNDEIFEYDNFYNDIIDNGYKCK